MSNTLTIATDGSAAQTRRGVWAGWSWVSSTGNYEAGHKRTGNILLAELEAIDRALAGTFRGAARQQDVRILTDSQAALRIVQQLLDHGTAQYRPGFTHQGQVDRTARHIAQQIRDHRDGGIELAWVRGHAGHPLNEAADRLARHCRISGGATTAAVTALYKQISREAATAWANAS